MHISFRISQFFDHVPRSIATICTMSEKKKLYVITPYAKFDAICLVWRLGEFYCLTFTAIVTQQQHQQFRHIATYLPMTMWSECNWLCQIEQIWAMTKTWEWSGPSEFIHRYKQSLNEFGWHENKSSKCHSHTFEYWTTESQTKSVFLIDITWSTFIHSSQLITLRFKSVFKIF